MKLCEAVEPLFSATNAVIVMALLGFHRKECFHIWVVPQLNARRVLVLYHCVTQCVSRCTTQLAGGSVFELRSWRACRPIPERASRPDATGGCRA